MVSSCAVLIGSSPSSIAPLVRLVPSFLFGSPFSSPRSAPRWLGPSPALSLTPPGSSRHLVVLSSRIRLSFFLSSSHPGSSHSRRRNDDDGAGNGDGGVRSFMRRFRQLVIVRPVIWFSSSVGARSSRPPSWRPRWEFPIISSGSSHPTHCPGSSRRRWRLSSFKQATASWRPLSSAHHLIPSRERWRKRRWRRWRLVRASRLMRLVHRLVLYRDINGGVGGADEASKRTRKNRRNRDEKPGSRTGRKTKRTQIRQRERGEGTEQEQTDGVSKQGGQREHGAITNKNKHPSSFSPDPLTIGSRRFAGLKQIPRPRGVGRADGDELASRRARHRLIPFS